MFVEKSTVEKYFPIFFAIFFVGNKKGSIFAPVKETDLLLSMLTK